MYAHKCPRETLPVQPCFPPVPAVIVVAVEKQLKKRSKDGILYALSLNGPLESLFHAWRCTNIEFLPHFTWVQVSCTNLFLPPFQITLTCYIFLDLYLPESMANVCGLAGEF